MAASSVSSVVQVPLLKEASPPVGDPISHVLGGMGMWQLRSFILVALVKLPSAWHMASILFIAPAPQPGHFWCAGPAIDSRAGLGAHTPVHVVPRNPCQAYYIPSDDWHPGNVSAGSVNTSTVPCSHFEFKRTALLSNTAVMQWQLVCERQVLVGVAQFFYLAGILAGGLLCRHLLVRYSPRKIILLAMMTQVLAGTSTAYVPQFECFVALRFVSAVALAHMFTCGYIICTDITDGRWRTVVGACYEHMWSAGVITLPLLAVLFSDWRHIQLAISLPTILLVAAYRWIPDSPRWLLAHGYIAEAQSVLRTAATYNGCDVSKVDTIPLSVKRKVVSRTRWVALFRPPNSSLRTFALHVAWAVTVASYYEGLLNVKNLGPALHLNTAIAGVAEVVGVLLGLRLLLRPGKWTALATVLLAGGLVNLLCWLLPLAEVWARSWLLVFVAMVGRAAIACSLTVLQEASMQLLPPEHRPLFMLSCVTVSRTFLLLTLLFVASLERNLLKANKCHAILLIFYRCFSQAEYGQYAPLSLFGVFSVVCGCASLLIERAPESTWSAPATAKLLPHKIADDTRNISHLSLSIAMETKESINGDCRPQDVEAS